MAPRSFPPEYERDAGASLTQGEVGRPAGTVTSPARRAIFGDRDTGERSVLRTTASLLLLIAGLTTLWVSGYSPSAALLGAGFTGLLFGAVVLVEQSRQYRLWAAYVLGIVVFSHLRSLADETFIATRFRYVIEIEEFLFVGHVPTVWLQERLYDLGEVSALDTFMVWVHLSYFFVPYAIALVFAVWAPAQFARYVVAALATFWIGLAIYYLVPTAPPWVASVEGHLPEVARIVREYSASVSVETYERGNRIVGPNDVAAMPSLHFAITGLVALTLWRFHWIVRVISLAYLGAMGLALVYLGEHYVTDLIAGLLVAVGGWWVGSRVVNRIRPYPYARS